ncbi:putative reverse transcriptase domain-containing protein [Tanacetum coccineum]
MFTVKRPKGIVENVLVGIDKFTFLVDFIILDIPEDFKTSLILGRPFLSTALAIINAFKAKITLSVGNDKTFLKSNKPTSNIIKRVYALSLIKSMEHDLEASLMGSEIHELPVCTIRRFKMIKYSFRQDGEYVAVKENKYDDLTRANENACRAYQEIFRMIDEGWMVTRAE